MSNITSKELNQKISAGERLQLIDVRTPGEFAAGHVPGAVNMPLEEVESRLRDMNNQDPVVLICQSGNRAGQCKVILESHREDLLLLEGGTSDWTECGYDVVRNASSSWSIERQVRLIVGVLLIVGVALTLTVSPYWIVLPGFLGLGLTFAGATNFCGMGILVSKMPWNRPRNTGSTAVEEAPQGS
jgi:rhodanese-related sulfurtransferase